MDDAQHQPQSEERRGESTRLKLQEELHQLAFPVKTRNFVRWGHLVLLMRQALS